MQVYKGLVSGTKKIDIDKVSSSVTNINNGMKNNILDPLLKSMQYVSDHINSSSWESPAKDKLCNGLMGMLLDNHNSIENSIDNLNTYITAIISNYNQMEQENINIFNNLF